MLGAMPPWLPLVLFVLTYAALVLGRVPGLHLDRTGIAILGAAAFLGTGCLTLEQARDAVDVPTLVVLFGMMLLSVQFRVAGLYDRIAAGLAADRRPRRLLVGVVVVTAALSAVLTNDVACFVLAPLLATSLRAGGRDPVPYLLALACAANVGSALTPIGNPQNILIAQSLSLAFLPFVLACAVPVALSLAVVVALLWRRVGEASPSPPSHEAPLVARVDRVQAAKALALTAAAIVLFLTPVPAWLIALGVAGVVLASRRLHTRDALAAVDWHLLALFVGLFVVVRGLEQSGWTEAAGRGLDALGADLGQPALLIPVVAVLSNAVSNVPAVMLLLPLVPHEPATGWCLALAATFAGNALLVGSIANLIVAEQARRLGLPFTAAEHARVGVPVTLASLGLTLLAAWLW